MSKVSLLYRSASLFKWGLTWFGPYWGTGITVKSVAADFSRVVVQMRMRWYNRNAFGTHFGGSLYAMCDPFYCLMLVAKLGPNYLVWDSAAQIDFVKPAKGTVEAVFDWSEQELAQIREAAREGGKVFPTKECAVTDLNGRVVAKLTKTLYVRLKTQQNAAPNA